MEFYFAFLDEELFAKEIQNLNLKKAIPNHDITVKS